MGGINTQLGKRLGERRASKGDRRGGAADSGLRRRAQGRRGRGAKQVARLRGEPGGESLQKVALPEWDCGEENPTRGQAIRSASRAPGRA